MTENVKIETEKTVKQELEYAFGERELKGRKYIVMGKVMRFVPKGQKEEVERVKGLWASPDNFKTLAPQIVALVKQYAPEALN